MGNESYQSDEREDKDLSESKHEKAVESGRKNQGESLRELYRSVCTRAHQAHGLSKKKDIERACDEYEASLNMISDAEKRSDLNEHFRELFEKARAEIEKHYKRTLEKMLEHEEWVTDKRENSEAPLIRPSPTEDGESPEKAGDGGEGSEGVIRIGEERPDDVRNTQVQDEGKTALSRKISEERGEAPSNQFSGSGSGRTRVSHREEPILEEGHDDATSTQAGMSIKDLLVDHTDQEKQTRPEQVPEQTSTHPPSKSSAEPVRYKQITKQNDEQALLPVLLRRFNSSSIFKTRQRKIAAALVAVMLLLLVLVALSSDTEKMTVQIPSKKTGDRAEYDVKGSLSADSETTFETTIGLLSGFDIQFQGFLIQQVNDTSTVKDGLDESHKALEEYLSQDLDMDGTIDLVGLNPKLRDGKLITHQTDYTDLTTNKTIRYKLSNIFRITIPTTEPPFSREIHSTDKGTFFTSSAQSPTFLSFLRSDFQNNLLPAEIREGDSNINEEYNLKWRACGTKTIAGYRSLAVVISEIESSDWYDLELKYWISSECPYPTRIEVKGWVDTGELQGDIVSDILRVYSGSSKVELSYTATLKQFERGDKEVSYGFCFGDHDRTHHDMANFVDWYPEEEYHVPVIFTEEEEGKATGFRDDFSAEDAYDFAINNSDELDGYLAKHKNGYAVEGEFFTDKDGEPSWDFSFGYFDKSTGIDSLLDPREDAYHIRLTGEQNGTNVTPSIIDEGEVEVIKPDRTNTNMKSVLSLASAEEIFKVDTETQDFAFEEEDGTSVIDFGSVSFRWETNSIGPAVGILSQFLPDRFDIPTLLGYHLIQNNTSEEESIYSERYLALAERVGAQIAGAIANSSLHARAASIAGAGGACGDRADHRLHARCRRRVRAIRGPGAPAAALRRH